MPSFQIFTNVASKDIPEDFEEDMTEVIKNVLGKPSNKVRDFNYHCVYFVA